MNLIDLFSDPEYLKNEQYRSSVNLAARIRLHELFSTNSYDYFQWIFDQILTYNPFSRLKVLEVGCGRADLWIRNLERVPQGWDITLSDFSPGMLNDARNNLGIHASRFSFEEVDAHNIPYTDKTFDLVIANAMLYHLPDRPKAIAEIRRVLKPYGKFHAATMGDHHMQEMDVLVQVVAPQYLADVAFRLGFSLDNGTEQLAPHFDHIQVLKYECNLVITRAEPMVNYLRSTIRTALNAEELNAFREEIQYRIDRDGSIFITKDGGTFVASGYAQR